MAQNQLGEPDKFELSSIVTKNSRSGIFSNRRLLIIKGGKLYYYSNIPKFFDGNIKALQVAHQLPKCSIDIVNIKSINEFDINSPFFSIEFNTKHMMEKQDIRNSAMNMDYNFTPRQNSQQVTWQFTCDNQFVKKRWVSALKMLKEYYKEEQIKIQKFMQSMDANSHPPQDSKGSSFSSRSSIKMPVPWRQSNFSRRSYNPDKGFQFQSSPKDSIKIQDMASLKHGKSDRSLKSAKNQSLLPPSPPPQNTPDASFQMVVYQQQTFDSKFKEHQKSNVLKIEDVFKRTASEDNKTSERKSYSRNSIKSMASGQMPVPTPIQQVSQDMSVRQTPVKENSISYSDSDSYVDRKMALEKLQPKQTSSEAPKMKKNLQVSQSYSIEVIGLSPVVEERNSFSLSRSQEQEPTPSPINISIKEPEHPIQAPNIKSTSSSKLEQSIKEEPQVEEDSHEYRFQYLWGQSCKNNQSFESKLSVQKQLLREMLSFKERAIESVSSWLDSKARGQNRYPIVEESPKYSVLEVGKILLKIANISTQKISINGSTKIFYNQDAIKNLKRQFKIHQNLFRSISKQLKSHPELRLRLPLCVYIEYKGVCCLASREHSTNYYISMLEDESYRQEMNFLLNEGYKPEWFAFKPIGKYLSFSLKPKSKYLGNDDQSIRQYLKKVVNLGRKEKNHNLVFDPPINKHFLQIAQKQSASTSIQSLQRYVKGLKLAKQLPGPCPKEQIIEALSYCLFCKQLRKVYRSAQGQIGQTHFFNLIFKKQPSILDLLKQSDCSMPSKTNAQLFSFIEHYFGIVLEIDEKNYQQYAREGADQKKDIFVSSVVKPIVRQYHLEDFEIIQAFSKLDSYLQNRHPLAKAALDKKKEVFALNQHLSLQQQLQILYNQSSYLYSQSDYTGCIKKCKQYEAVAPPKSTTLFPIYLLMMKAYSQFSQPDFTTVFKKCVILVELNYGRLNSSLINLNSLAAFYYQKLMSVSNNKNPGLLECSIRLMKQAQQLCLNIFGNCSKQYLDIMLDSSRLYSKYDMNVAVAYLDDAKKVCQANPTLFNAQNLISVLSLESSLNIKRGMYSQADASLNHAISLIDSRIPMKTKIHLFKLQHEVGFYTEKFQICQEAIEKLWDLGTNEKLQALEMAYRLAFKETGISEAEVLGSESIDSSFEHQQRGLIQIQQSKQQYDNLVDMLATSIETGNYKLLQLVYWLIHDVRRSSLNVSYT